jgi:hypothetical protein
MHHALNATAAYLLSMSQLPCFLLLLGTHLSSSLLVVCVPSWSLATAWTLSAWAALDVVALLLA